MQTQDLISWQQILKKVPTLLANMPAIIEGIRLTRFDDPSTPVGLALEFEAAAMDNPKGIAILGTEQRLTYSQVNRLANQLAYGLKELGLSKGDIVGFYVENRPETLVGVLACAKLGLISAMFNTQTTTVGLLQTIKLVAPKLIFVGEELITVFNSIVDDLPNCEHVVCIPDTLIANQHRANTISAFRGPSSPPLIKWHQLNRLMKQQPSTNLESSKKIYLHDPLFYVFTSGTSGLPKAGIFTHGRWMKLLGGIGKLTTDLNKDDVLYATMPLYHATALCVCWCSVIAARAGFAIGRKFSASQFWQETQRFHATAIGYVGDLCQFLMAQPPRDLDQQHSVRLMLGNGLRPAIWEKFKNRFNIETVYEFYGASDGNVGFFNILNLNNTVGFSPNKFAIVSVDDDLHLPIRGDNGFFIRVQQGGTGLLISEINTHFPLDGYTEKKETEKIILKNAFETGDRWLNTGDLMRDLGFRHTQFIDRVGESYRWHGENISTQEVEKVISERGNIEQVIAYGVDVPHHAGKAGMITMILNSSSRFNATERRLFLFYLRSQLPSYAIPRFIRITGKLDTTSTFKFKKNQYQKEGYNPEIITDKIYLYHAKANTYNVLTTELFKKIQSGDLKL